MPEAVPDPLSFLSAEARGALVPVGHLFRGLTRSSTRRWIATRVEAELLRLRGLVGPRAAGPALALRLQRRLREDANRVLDPVGWLLGRGLPQRTACWSVLCDDGWDMARQEACRACAARADDTRALRDQVRAGSAAREIESEPDRHRYVDRHTHALVSQRIALALARGATPGRPREATGSRIPGPEEPETSRPCVRCGAPDAGGHCPECLYRVKFAALVHAYAVTVVARRYDPAMTSQDTLRQVALAADEFRDRVERDIGAGKSGHPGAAFAERWLIGSRLLDELRRAAHAEIARGVHAEQHARTARLSVLSQCEARLRLRCSVEERQKISEQAKRAADSARKGIARFFLQRNVATVETIIAKGVEGVIRRTEQTGHRSPITEPGAR
ncbi:hypothetical protein ACWCPJ_34320 [Streptomyces collinus]